MKIRFKTHAELYRYLDPRNQDVYKYNTFIDHVAKTIEIRGPRI